YFDFDPLHALLKILSPSSNSAETCSRVLYALSGLLKPNAAAVKKMSVVDGWSALRMCLEDSEIRVRRKTTFLLNTLLLPSQPPIKHRPSHIRKCATPNPRKFACFDAL
ncbi:uncharacterized protein F5147DRAFT_585273, partial [Suillus discolor]